jgi:hypothetical protein
MITVKKYYKLRLMSGFQDTRSNQEDFAITPYLFGVFNKHKLSKSSVYGFGFCWGFYAIYFSLGFNIPKGFPLFMILKK